MQAFPSAVAQRNNILMRVVVMALPVVILLAMAVPTVLAQNTYTIVDGSDTMYYTTSATDPEHVLTQAGITLEEGDIYTAESGKAEIIVRRLQNITVYNCGKQLQVTGNGETVKALLDRLEIPSDGEYVPSVDVNAQTFDGMEIRVDRVIKTQQTYTADIPYETTYCYDPGMVKDEQKVVVEGKNGQRQLTADVTYVNSAETERTIVADVVIEPVVNKVILVGTGEVTDENSNAPAIGDGVIVTADGQVLTYSKTGQFKATAYTHTDDGCNTVTATGTTVRYGTVAVDPKVIPYGTRMFIVSNDGKYIYGIGTAEDCGGGIKGNRLDLYFPVEDDCWEFGVRGCKVYFLD